MKLLIVLVVPLFLLGACTTSNAPQQETCQSDHQKGGCFPKPPATPSADVQSSEHR